MNRPNALHAATIVAVVCVVAVCSWAPRSAPAAPTSNPTAHAATPLARAAHTGAPKHARGACRVTRGRRHKHHKHCATHARTPHTRSSHSRPHKPSRAETSSSLRTAHPHARTPAKRAGGPGAIVTVGSPNASTIAAVLDTPCQNTELTPEAANLEQIRAATLCLVNQERARENELPLQPNARLEQSSQRHSEEMVAEDYFAHIAPNGETPLQRIEATGYIPNSQVGYTIGENIAWGTLYLATPSAIVAAWIASPEHLANILNAEYRDTAMGVDPAAPPSLSEGEPGAVYTQEFGVIQG
jgi:uncharacterized protein YkwD